MLRHYRRKLRHLVSDELRYAAEWLRNLLIAVIAILGAEVLFQGWELVLGRLNYFNVFGLYLIIAALGLYLAVEGWRHDSLAFPRPDPSVDGRAPPPSNEKDWASLGARWASRVDVERWWADPDLSLAEVATRLGVNTHHLSRAINEGLGVNFAGFINRFRCQAVADALTAGTKDDLLTLALEAGFSSKASFNRSFKATFGVTPSDFRRRAEVSEPKLLARQRVLRRAAG